VVPVTVCACVCVCVCIARTWTPQLSLTLLVLYEALYAVDSFWKPYFRMVPVDFSGHPNWMSDADISLARRLRTLQNLTPQPIPAMTDFFVANVLCKHPALFGECSAFKRLVQWPRELRWALTMAGTRSHSARFEGDVVHIIPLLDFCNHDGDRGSPSHYVVADADAASKSRDIGYAMVATVDYRAVRIADGVLR
jgi:hypothetical protein